MDKVMRLFALKLLIIVSYSAFSQGYQVKIRVQNWKDTTAYLGHYYGESTYLKDTARVNSKGEFTFDGKKTLGPGIYFVVLNKTKIFEFVIGSTQYFSLETKGEDYYQHMKVAGDEDNRLFFENMLFNMARHKEAEPYLKVLKDSTLSKADKEVAQKEFEKINEKVMAYQKSIVQTKGATVTAALLKSTMPVTIPDPPKKADGTIDSSFQLRWYRQHFFDNFDLGNEALIRLPRPVYEEKVSEYLDKLYAPVPDTLMRALDIIVSKAKRSQETYKYAVWSALLKYQQPEIMGLDEMYVRIFDKYFASGEMNFWVSASLMKTLKEQADRMRKSLIGKRGPDLIMQDANFKPRALYDLKNKYSVVFIFDPDCGHCKQETPKLVDFYEKNKTRFDLEVYAVSTDTSMAKMRDFIKEMKTKWITVNGPRTYVGPYSDLYDAITTPSLFVLDREKKIIGKKIPAEKLEDFFTHYEKVEKLRAKNPSAKAGR